MKTLAAFLIGSLLAAPAGAALAQAQAPNPPPPPDAQGQPQGPPQSQPLGGDSLGADWGGQQDQVRAGVRQGRYVPLGRVIAEIRGRAPGRELDAGLEQWNGKVVYRVRWATANGRRVDYIVDAQSAAILGVE